MLNSLIAGCSFLLNASFMPFPTPKLPYRSAIPALRDSLAYFLQVRRFPRVAISGNLKLLVLWLGVAHRGLNDARA